MKIIIFLLIALSFSLATKKFASKSSSSLGMCGRNFYNGNPTQMTNGHMYITLKNPNYSSNQNGGNFVTNWQAINIDPLTLLVNTGDYTFSTTTGSNKVPYAFAAGCKGTWIPDAHSRIDLTGTPYAVDDMFVINGYLPNGNVTFSSNNQVVDIWGGGDCGWTAPVVQDAQNRMGSGGPFLKLTMVKC